MNQRITLKPVFTSSLEEAAAKKLRRIFLDADKCANYAAEDVVRLEKALNDAKLKALEESRRAHQSALEAAEKAQKVANELALEVNKKSNINKFFIVVP